MILAVRGYGVPLGKPKKKQPAAKRTRKGLTKPSREALLFDCETMTEHSQALRVGTYQIRKDRALVERGIYYEVENPKALSRRDIRTIQRYANKHGYVLRTREEFVREVFFRYAFRYGATVVGFNLPFDISRLAIGVAASHAHDMRNAFSLKLIDDRYLPNVLVKHLNARTAFMRFASLGQRDGRGMRKAFKTLGRRGFFVDLKTLSAALLGRSHSLKTLADSLETETRKLEVERHGGPITEPYLDYAMADTQVTADCYASLLGIYGDHGLTLTQPHQIYSEASLGKGYLKEMAITPWRKGQPT